MPLCFSIFFCISSKIGLRVFSADLKSDAVTLILYLGAPTYKTFTLFWCVFSKYDSVYDGVVDILTNGIKVFNDLKLPKKTLDIIEEVSTKIKLPSVEIRGILELTDNSSNGIENIRNSLLGFENADQNDVKILYIGAPKYRISVTASDFKSAEKTLKPILEYIQKNIEKNKGNFKFTREESKKTGEG